MSSLSCPTDIQPLVSVIIPIYNVEKYLGECVESVRNQTYKNIEIILVDDGSPDACGAMCDAYAAQDDRVRVIHRENGGLSAARNSGMEVATGEFVTFLDSDDWMYIGAIEGYMKCFAKYPELDIVESRIYFSGSGKPSNVGEYIVEPQLEDRLLSGSELIHHFCTHPYTSSLPAAWNKCYRAQLVQGHRFVEGRVYEDLEFQLRLYPHVKAYLLWGQVNYYYREGREGAITETSVDKVIPRLMDSYENMKQIILDIEAQIARGEMMSGSISAEEHRRYVIMQFMTDIINPPFCDIRSSYVRSVLIPVQKPYVKFLASRPYVSSHRHMRLAHRIMAFSYTFYMRVYLPIFLKYLELKAKRRAHR